jgi:hypothetical protein
VPSRLVDKLFGRSFGWRWVAWFALAFTFVVVTRECVFECTPNEWVLSFGLGLLGWCLLIGGLWLNLGGVAATLTYLQLRKLRRQLDPLASALGASIKTRWDGMDRCTIVYRLPGHYVAVPVGPGGGFNAWSKTSDERFDKHPPSEVDVLLAAAHRVCGTPGG